MQQALRLHQQSQPQATPTPASSSLLLTPLLLLKAVQRL